MSRNKKQTIRKSVTFRFASGLLTRLEKAAISTHKSKTQLIEESLGAYLNELHLQGMI